MFYGPVRDTCGRYMGDEQRLPAGPLIDRLAARYGSMQAIPPSPTTARQLHRMRHIGLGIVSADRCRGVGPGLVVAGLTEEGSPAVDDGSAGERA